MHVNTYTKIPRTDPLSVDIHTISSLKNVFLQSKP